MPDEAVEDFIAHAAGAMGDEPARGMPGEMPDDEDEVNVQFMEHTERPDEGAALPQDDDETDDEWYDDKADYDEEGALATELFVKFGWNHIDTNRYVIRD